MENRDKYIQMRKEHKYDLQWFYKYYIENFDNLPPLIRNNNPIPRHKLTFQEFVEIFQMYLQMAGNDILEYLDKKFNVSKIENKEGEIIYIN